jgi:hypothetical protein
METEEPAGELTAASALTSLVNVTGKGSDEEEETTEHEDDEATVEADKPFIIPQKFTKSGRKRAVPFPLKVRT